MSAGTLGAPTSHSLLKAYCNFRISRKGTGHTTGLSKWRAVAHDVWESSDRRLMARHSALNRELGIYSREWAKLRGGTYYPVPIEGSLATAKQ